MSTAMQDDGNGNYVVSKRFGLSIGIVVVLIIGVAAYFTAEASQTAALIERDEALRLNIEEKLSNRVDMQRYSTDLTRIEMQLNRIEGKLDQLKR